MFDHHIYMYVLLIRSEHQSVLSKLFERGTKTSFGSYSSLCTETRNIWITLNCEYKIFLPCVRLQQVTRDSNENERSFTKEKCAYKSMCLITWITHSVGERELKCRDYTFERDYTSKLLKWRIKVCRSTSEEVLQLRIEKFVYRHCRSSRDETFVTCERVEAKKQEQSYFK